MALVNCRECGNSVSDSAKTCPRCGAKVKKKSGLLKLLATGVVSLVALMTIGGLLSDGSSSSTPQTSPETLERQRAKELDANRESHARIIAEREIRARLKAPRGAKFSGYSSTKVGKLSGGTANEWVVQGYVDAENSFGAMLRNNYQVIIEFEEGKYDSSRTKSAELLN